jgi:uncharacterized membrane protein YcaP (DUF421 family)
MVESEPLIIIQKGNVNDKNMAKSRYHIGDLLMQLRDKDVFDITEVEFAILEPNGDLSVLKKSQYNSITPKDLSIPTKDKGLMTELIINGEIMLPQLKMLHLDVEWLLNQLKTKSIKNIEDVIVAILQTDGQLYIVLKDCKILYNE